MSVDATIWAWSLTKQQVSSLEKLILLSLADRADEQNECYPSKERLAQDICADRKTIFSCINSLIKKGFLELTGKKRGRLKNIDVYRLIGVPLREKFNRTENGTDKSLISTENGTLNRTENGIQNLSVEPILKTINKKKELVKNPSMGLGDVLDCNPFNIKKSLLSDWIDIRKSRRAIVTATAWDCLNRELDKCEKLGISPQEAFETMVINGWTSLKADWIKTRIKNKKSHFDHESTEWAKGIEEDLF